jgi:hypothetical protein
MRLPFASPAPYDAWKARDDDYSDDGRSGDYGSGLQQSARENARAATRARQARPMVTYDVSPEQWESVQDLDDYGRWCLRWGVPDVRKVGER